MCTGLELASLAASAGGVAISAGGQAQAAREADREARRRINTNLEASRRANQRVNQEIQSVAKSNSEGERTAANQEFMDALRNAKMQDGGDSFGDVGGASRQYAEDVNAARTEASAEGRATASNLARLDAPLRQRVREGTGFTNAGVDLSLLDRDARGQDFLSQLRTSMIRNRGDTAGQFLSGLGSSLAVQAPAAKPVAAPGAFPRLPSQAPRPGVFLG